MRHKSQLDNIAFYWITLATKNFRMEGCFHMVVRNTLSWNHMLLGFWGRTCWDRWLTFPETYPFLPPWNMLTITYDTDHTKVMVIITTGCKNTKGKAASFLTHFGGVIEKTSLTKQRKTSHTHPLQQELRWIHGFIWAIARLVVL